MNKPELFEFEPIKVLVHTSLDDYYSYSEEDPSCFSVGMGGDCGFDCPVFLRGKCSIGDEIASNENIHDHFPTNVVDEIQELYGVVDN